MASPKKKAKLQKVSKDVEQLKKRSDIDGAFNLAPQILETVRFLGACATIYGCIVVVMQSVQAFAGLDTKVNAVVDLPWMEHLPNIFGTLFGASGFVYGRAKHRQLARERSNLALRAKNAEEVIDPKRSSSHLTENGDNRPEDKY